MRYKTINEQIETIISILKQNKDLMLVLDYINTLKLPNFYLAGGAIFQTVWNYYDNNPLNKGIKDIDIIYYDASDMSVEKDLAIYNKVKNHFKNLNYEFDISNEARMHLWTKEHNHMDIAQYKNSEDAIDNWIATVHAIGITKENDKIKIYAPYGLSDIFSKTIRPIKHKDNKKEMYDKKVASWKERFHDLTVIEW